MFLECGPASLPHSNALLWAVDFSTTPRRFVRSTSDEALTCRSASWLAIDFTSSPLLPIHDTPAVSVYNKFPYTIPKPAEMMFGKSLHILCFGDSLTVGFSLTGAKPHPYEIAMRSTLQKAFPTFEITTDVQGLSGDQVTSPPGGFLPRMDVLCESAMLCFAVVIQFLRTRINSLFQTAASRNILYLRSLDPYCCLSSNLCVYELLLFI